MKDIYTAAKFHKILILSLISLVTTVTAQTKKVKLENEETGAIETFQVLKDNPEIRQGKYEKKYHSLLALGQYDNNKKSGIWAYYDRKGELEQKINFDNAKLIFSKPFIFCKGYFVNVGGSYQEVVPDEIPVFIGGDSYISAFINRTLDFELGRGHAMAIYHILKE